MSQNKYDQIVENCKQLLYECPAASQALTYLDNRLTPEAQKKFSFGFFPSQDKIKILLNMMSEEELLKTELVYKDYVSSDSGQAVLLSPLQNHNLIMPYKDPYGRIIAVVGRTLLNEQQLSKSDIPKYKNTSFKKSRNLFGLYESKQSIIANNYAYIVEGQFDCIKAHSNNIQNVVALGSSNMSQEQLILLLRYTSKIKLLLDNDEAGVQGRKRILEKYAKYTNISNVYIPQGFKDLDEFLHETKIHSRQELEAALINN